MAEPAGIQSVESRYSVKETIDRLAAAAEGAGLRIFDRIDHAKGAAEIGSSMRPTELLVMGHPRGGTPLMLERQLAGIDLPLKALAWEDVDGRVWLSYDTGTWIAERHGLGQASAEAVTAIDVGITKLASVAAQGNAPG